MLGLIVCSRVPHVHVGYKTPWERFFMNQKTIESIQEYMTNYPVIVRPEFFSKNLPEELVFASSAAKFGISLADFFKPGTVNSAEVLGAAVRALDLINAIRHRSSHLDK